MIYQKVTDYLSKTSITYKTSADEAEAIVDCPFCDDAKKHLYIKNTDGCYYCQKCGAKGSWKNLLESLGINDEVFLESNKGEETIEYKAKLNTKKLDPTLVEKYQKDLPQRIVDYLKSEKRGLTDETIKNFKIGWDGKSITFPVFDKKGNLVNIRHRRDPEKEDGAKMWNEKGGSAALFNIGVLSKKPSFVIICEGEFDAMVAVQNGFDAVSGTAGAGTFKEEWIKEFDEIETIYILYDTDNAGKEGNEKVAGLFNKRTRIVFLPQEKDEKVDVTSYFANGHKAEDFKKLLDNAQEFKVKTKDFEIMENNLKSSIHPAIDFQYNKLFIGIKVPVKIDKTEKVRTVIITSSKEKALIERDRIIINEEPLEIRKVTKIPGINSRWNVENIRKFFESKSPSSPSLPFIEIKQTLLKFVDFRNESDADILALWIMASYLFPIFDAFPYLYFVGVKRSGKTKTLLIIEKLAFNGILSSNISPSVLFRLVEALRCTLALDESEQLFDKSKKEDLRELLNSGYKRGAPALRTKKDKKGNFGIEAFEIYSPKAIANISGLDSVLEDRAITITMVRTNNPDKGNLAITDAAENWAYLRSILYEFALTHAGGIADIYINDPDVNALLNRQNELWRPLLSLAKLIDDELPGTFEQIKEEAIRRAQEASNADLEDFDSAVLLALQQLATSTGFVTNKEIREKAVEFLEVDQRQYFTSRGVGAALKRFGISGKKVQGYWRYNLEPEVIEELLKRYGVDTTVTFQ